MSLLYILCTYTPPPTSRCERFDERFDGFHDCDGNWLPTGETTAKGSPSGAQSREMGPSLGGPGEKSEKPRRKPVAVRDE